MASMPSNSTGFLCRIMNSFHHKKAVPPNVVVYQMVRGYARRVTRTWTTCAGFTLSELLVFCAMFAIITATVIFVINPVEIAKKARDAKRIGDVEGLSWVMEHYIADNGNPADTNQVLRTSTVSASASGKPANSNGSGWIPVNLTGYTEKLPLDPINKGEFIYRYYRLGNVYKIDARLEYQSAMMTKDGGTDNCRYEVGSGVDSINLTPISSC